jgi:hypothetical protein
MIDRHMEQMALAQTRVGRYDALRSAMDATKDLLTEVHGWDPKMASKLTKMVDEATVDTRGYFVNQIGENVNVPGMWAKDPLAAPKPHLYNEFINRAMELPDARDVRAATSMFAPILKNGTAWTARDIGTSASISCRARSGSAWRCSVARTPPA